MAPSPIRATTLSCRPCMRAASARPSAAEMEVEECPTPKASNGLSLRLGNPLMPPFVRIVRNASRRPVSTLCA